MIDDSMTNGNNKLILKESNMASSIHEDTGFCSGEEYMENEVHSPTDSSEDSVEVKVSTITFKSNKRRLPEPLQKKELLFSGPLKKRMCLKVKAEEENNDTNSAPFRPWSPETKRKNPVTDIPIVTSSFATPFPLKVESTSTKTETPISSFSYFRPPSPTPFAQQQSEPVALVIKRESDDRFNIKSSEMRVPIHPEICTLSTAETERLILKTNEQFPSLQREALAGVSASNCVKTDLGKMESKREQRNYKNMTRERRIEANARERTRVHTISAAFDTLRRSIPSYSHNQKLSKLSVLRIACSYIMTLSSIVENDTGESATSEYVDMVSRTIQREGKLRKKKDDND